MKGGGLALVDLTLQGGSFTGDAGGPEANRTCKDARTRLVDNIGDGPARVKHPDIVERSIGYFHNAGPDYGDRIAKAISNRPA